MLKMFMPFHFSWLVFIWISKLSSIKFRLISCQYKIKIYCNYDLLFIYFSYILYKRPLGSYACPNQNQRNRTNKQIFLQAKKYSKLVPFYGKVHCMCEPFHIFGPKGSFCSPSLYPPNHIDWGEVHPIFCLRC